MEVEEIISSGLLELFVSGLATAEEAVQVEAWAKKYPEVRLELDHIQRAMESYAQEQAVIPDPSIKNKILSRIGQQAPTVSSAPVSSRAFQTLPGDNHQTVLKRVPLFYKYAAAASIVLFIISAVVGYNYYNQYKEANQQLQVAQQSLQQQLQLSQVMHSELDTISNKYAHPVLLNGTDKAPDAAAKIYWMKDKGGAVWVDAGSLPEVPAGKQYQLWAIIDGKPVDAGMISTSRGIYHIQKMKSFGNVQAFAITMEATGGSPTPKGEMVVMSKI